MRDPSRIDETLAVIEQLWRRFPDWRLGQLISNIAGGDNRVFYIEDEPLTQTAFEMIQDAIREETR